MDYNRGTGDLANWLVSEPEFDTLYQGKCEAIMSLGNGYMGVRSATEESYVGQVRNCFVAGTFNRFAENEVSELPNAADVTALDIYIDKELFTLEKGEVRNYHRTLNLKTGELEREFEWTNPEGKSFQFSFRRFVSFTDLHTLAAKIKITPLSGKCRNKDCLRDQWTNDQQRIPAFPGRGKEGPGRAVCPDDPENHPIGNHLYSPYKPSY